MSTLNRKLIEKVYAPRKLEKLYEIDINSHKINSIDSNTFKGLTILTNLTLSKNEIAEINETVFDSLSCLKVLWLNENKLKSIHSNTFKGLANLERLSLENNQIGEVVLDNLPNLKDLWMSKNKLTHIDSNAFKGLVNLEKLGLEKNEIDVIDASSFEMLVNLKYLNLWNNRLKKVDSITFRRLAELETLSLCANAITDIDRDTFKELVNLKRLNLNSNAIEKIDFKAFESLSKLLELNLAFNKLKEIDRRCFEPLKSIELVELYGNKELANNTLSFYKSSTSKSMSDNLWYIDSFKLNKNGFKSDWDSFLVQFSEIAITDFRKVNLPISSSALKHVINLGDKDELIGVTIDFTYKIEKQIGDGANGRVYLANDESNNIKDQHIDEKELKEVDILCKLNHENVIKYYDHFEVITSDLEAHLCIVTANYENGDLGGRIRYAIIKNEKFSDNTIFKWFLQATSGLNFIHSKSIVHRDIKPGNIFLTHDNQIRIGDLGSAKVINQTRRSMTIVGTHEYFSPELYHEGVGSSLTDIWSLGCVIYELIFLKIAFPNGQVGYPAVPDLGCSLIFSNFLKKMLVVKTDERINSKKLYEDLTVRKLFIGLLFEIIIPSRQT